MRGAVFDPDLGWRLVPGITKKDGQWMSVTPATTNSLGWRDDEFASEKATDRARILALGDSFTFGVGVDYGDRFSEVLERDRPETEVLNMGVFAYGPDQALLAYELHGRSVDPDIVVLGLYLGNDLDDIKSRVVHSFPKPYFVLDPDSLVLVRPKPSWSVAARSRSYIAELVFRITEGRQLRWETAPELVGASEIDLLLAVLNRLSTDTAADEANLLVVVIHPRDASADQRTRYEFVTAEIQRAGHNLLDLREVFLSASQQGEHLYLADGHWNPAGHRLVAEALQAELVGRGWLPEVR
ncbi:MAG: SGNH/GDSL hydrolase family protein [Gemmatimonadota bacterium]